METTRAFTKVVGFKNKNSKRTRNDLKALCREIRTTTKIHPHYIPVPEVGSTGKKVYRYIIEYGGIRQFCRDLGEAYASLKMIQNLWNRRSIAIHWENQLRRY